MPAIGTIIRSLALPAESKMKRRSGFTQQISYRTKQTNGINLGDSFNRQWILFILASTKSSDAWAVRNFQYVWLYNRQHGSVFGGPVPTEPSAIAVPDARFSARAIGRDSSAAMGHGPGASVHVPDRGGTRGHGHPRQRLHGRAYRVFIPALRPEAAGRARTQAGLAGTSEHLHGGCGRARPRGTRAGAARCRSGRYRSCRRGSGWDGATGCAASTASLRTELTAAHRGGSLRHLPDHRERATA